MPASTTLTRRNRVRLAFIVLISSTFGLTSFISLCVSHATQSPPSPSAFHNSASKTTGDTRYPNRTLGVASRLYVISLLRRADRRLRMDAIAQAMQLDFTYETATDSSDPIVLQIMERVRWERTVQAIQLQLGLLHELPAQHSADLNGTDRIDWAQDALPNPFFVANSSTHLQHQPLGLHGSDLWILDASIDNRSTQFTNPIPPPPNPDLRVPIPCAPLPLSYPWTSHGDTRTRARRLARQAHVSNTPPASPYPFHKTLSRGMIACWHSHMRVLRLIAEGPDEVAIIFEDDIDMELDLYSRLAHMWSSLPPDWDIVMLGHCWSPENTNPAIYTSGRNSLHPSFAPKCTHAYAVSKSGASRLVRHLRTSSTSTGPAFAYGRALDQAFARLIKGRRIRAFSVVPSVVVQTKDTPSDIMGGNGSAWRNDLVNSALAKTGLGVDVTRTVAQA